MKKEKVFTYIPVGEVKCIWMSSGVVDFKLCDKCYDCDNCEYYKIVRESKVTIHEDKFDNISFSEYKDKLLSFLQQYYIEEGYYYYQNHTWIKLFDWNKASIGLDPLISRLLPKNVKIILAVQGSYIKQGQPCCWLNTFDSTFTIKSPLSGYVKEINEDLFCSPELISQSPYDKGWLFTINPIEYEQDKKHLMDFESMSNVCLKDTTRIEKKFSEVVESHKMEIGTTLMDGGEVVTNLVDLVGRKRYIQIIKALFRPKIL